MTERVDEVASHRCFTVEPSAWGLDVARYAAALSVVAGLGAGIVLGLGRIAPDQDASDVEGAVLIDFPAAASSSQQASAAAEGPDQQAAQASVAQPAPPQAEPPKDNPKPQEVAKPDTPEPHEEPPPVVRPDPPAVLERKQDDATPPTPVVAPAIQAQEERAPIGSQVPSKVDADTGDDSTPRPSSHAISLWQKSLMRRLEASKRQLGHEPHAAGTVKIAFSIDARGALASEAIATSSGTPSLDKAALLLIKQASPFPAPPHGSRRAETSFVVPIRFR